jgi:hypothetical protein
MDLPDELRTSILASSGKSPLLHHLNADSSWLFQIPYPPNPSYPTSNDRRGLKSYFNILLDPWLDGPQSDVAGWFSKQWHAIPPKYPSIKHVEELCKSVEEVLENEVTAEGERWIDAVVVSHEFTDHCHRQTLEGLDKSTAVFANDKAIELIKSWKHFDASAIYEIPSFAKDWLSLSKSPLPAHISLSRLQDGGDFLYYHSAIVIAFTTRSELGQDQGQSLIYTPHGLPSSDTNPFADCNPPLQTLALLHGLHDVQIPWTGPFSSGTQQLNLGAHNAVKLQRQIKAKYWLSTHDEVKKGGGLVGLILKRDVITLEDAIKAEEEKLKGEEGSSEKIEVVDLENGKGMVLS